MLHDESDAIRGEIENGLAELRVAIGAFLAAGPDMPAGEIAAFRAVASAAGLPASCRNHACRRAHACRARAAGKAAQCSRDWTPADREALSLVLVGLRLAMRMQAADARRAGDAFAAWSGAREPVAPLPRRGRARNARR